MIVMILVGWYAYPKTMIHPNYLLMHPGFVSTTSDRFLLYYHGFDLMEFPDIFGRQFYKYRLINEHEITYLYDVSKKEPGYIDFSGYYPDGQLSIVGQCYMKFQGGGLKIPMPDDTNILSATCYRPDGSVASEVVNGSGIYTYWHPEGYKSIENTFLNCERILEKRWYANGQLQSTRDYQDGSFTSYDKDGHKAAIGKYERGYKTGAWTFYNPNGSINRVEHHNDPNQNPVIK